MKQLKAVILAACLTAVASISSATEYKKIAGTSIDVFYDVAFFGAGNVSMLGDTVSVQMEGWNGTGSSSSASESSGKYTFADSALVVAPHAGLKVSSSVGLEFIGTGHESVLGVESRLDWFVGVNKGAFFEERLFQPSGFAEGTFVYISVMPNEGLERDVTFDLSSRNPSTTRWGHEKYDEVVNLGGYYSVIGVDLSQSIGGGYDPVGASSMTLNTVNYSFTTAAAVPEPSMAMLFVSGILALGMAVKRNKRRVQAGV